MRKKDEKLLLILVIGQLLLISLNDIAPMWLNNSIDNRLVEVRTNLDEIKVKSDMIREITSEQDKRIKVENLAVQLEQCKKSTDNVSFLIKNRDSIKTTMSLITFIGQAILLIFIIKLTKRQKKEEMENI